MKFAPPDDATFREFIASEPVPVPTALDHAVQSTQIKLLHPSLAQVFLALAGIHALSSLAVLAVCPHFGFELFPGFGGLPVIFMRVNMEFCMAACGAIFMATGFLSATWVLPAEYLAALRRYRIWYPAILTLLSGSVLIGFGDGVVFSWVILWLLGGMFSALAALQLGIHLRKAI